MTVPMRTAGPATARAHAWYTPVDAPADLQELVACGWTAVPTGRHRLTPDGCVDLLWLSSRRLVVCGPETRSWEFELPVGTTAVGVRFRPGAASVVLARDASLIADRLVPLEELVGPVATTALDERLSAHSGLDEARDELVGWVRELAGPRRRNDPFAEAVLGCLLRSPRAGQAEIASVVGMSVRQLHRRSSRAFGYGTATLARLLRFQRLLALAEEAEGRTSLAVLAARAGYADQAHLSRDCRSITGVAPTRFLAEWFPTFPDMSDPYKTERATRSNLAR